MFEIIYLIIGFFIGVVIVGVAVEIGFKKGSTSSPSSKHTKSWSISEISNPRVVAEYLSDVDIPKNSKVLVRRCKNKAALNGLDVKEHHGIRGNFVLGDDRVLILAGPVKKDELGIWTVEKEIVEQLNSEFESMWAEGAQMQFDETTNN